MSWKNLFNFSLRKKVFGLEQALKAESLAPIPAEHATTAMAVLEAVGVPVTAGAEAAEKMEKLRGEVSALVINLAATKSRLQIAPLLANGGIDALRIELKKFVDATREASRRRAERVDNFAGAVVALVERIAGVLVTKILARGDARVNATLLRFEKRIAAVEANMQSDLASYRSQVEHLEGKVSAARVEFWKLEPIAEKWTLTLPVKK